MEKYIYRDGYILRIPTHGPPQYEHRRIAEIFLGRRLEYWEVVHHINGRKWDNRPENLCVMSRYYHRRYHGWYRWIFKSYGNYPRRKTQIDRLKRLFDGILLDDILNYDGYRHCNVS